MKGETKEQRFQRIVEKRVQRLLDGFRTLAQTSNKRMYQWNDDQLKKIWSAIETELKKCKASFAEDEEKEFKL